MVQPSLSKRDTPRPSDLVEVKLLPIKTLSDYQWTKGQISEVCNIADKVADGGPRNEFGAYTVFKLVSVKYYSEVFFKVARASGRKGEGFDGAVYVDLFAGSGLVRIADTKDTVAGSAICALQNKFGFDYAVCVEIRKDLANALRKRLARISSKDRFQVIEGDCNQCIGQVVDSIRERFTRPIVYAFVDPEGMEIKWRTLKSLSDHFLNTDFMITVPPSATHRVGGKLAKGIDEVKMTFEEYWNQDAKEVLAELADGVAPENKYQKMVSEALGKVAGENIPIRDAGDRIAYYVLGYTRSTRGGSGYSNAFRYLKERLSKADRQLSISILDQIKKRAGTLESASGS